MNSSNRQRVLILTVSAKDAQGTQNLCSRSDIESVIIKDSVSLFAELTQGAGALLVAKEALNQPLVKEIAAFLDLQPRWSFLPIIMLVGAGDLSSGRNAVLDLIEPLRNMTLLERPVRTRMLVSIIKAALADRLRQYALREAFEDLERSKTEAIAANEAKSSFLANMSHEIRTPLGSIVGFAELLVDGATSEAERTRFIETIRRNGQLLSSLINDVLDLAKVEAGHLAIEDLEAKVTELFEDVITALSALAASKKITLDICYGDHLPQVILTDPVRIKQILINVVGNAIKFTAVGSVTIKVEARDGLLQVLICDTGIGMSAPQAANLFKPFSQADSSITRRFGGTGLGLALSKKLAEALGGHLILLETTERKGSVFEFVIPLKLASAQSNPAENDANLFALSLKGKRILVADDSSDNQFLISRILRSTEAEIVSAVNGKAAVELTEKFQFDAVLMDVQMPVMDGHEAASILRGQGFVKPIIALTAHALKEDRDRAITAGCDDYLTKPIEKVRLFETLRRLM